jgi:putative membrane protein
MYWDHMNGWGWTMMVVWSLVWIGFLGVVAWVAVRWARSGPPGSASEQRSTMTAREVLDERLARGDIDLDEYQRRRQALEQHTPTGG